MWISVRLRQGYFFKAMFGSDNCTREMKLMASNLKVIMGVLDTVTLVYRMEHVSKKLEFIEILEFNLVVIYR